MEEKEYEKFKAKMKDEFSSFNHHKNGSMDEIFRNPGAKIIYQRPNPFYICSHLNDNCNRKLFMSPDAPIDEALKSISLGYDCSTFLISDTDDSFSHSSEIPSRLCHQEKDHAERYCCFLRPLSYNLYYELLRRMA